MSILTELREKQGLTVSEIADKMQCTRQNVSLIEQNDIPERRETLDRYLKAIDVSFEAYIKILEEMQRRKIHSHKEKYEEV